MGFDRITLVSEPSEQRLNPRQRQDYREHRRALFTWALEDGKDPAQHIGYAASTLRYRAQELDQFYRWVWDQEDQYTTAVTPDQADAYTERLLAKNLKASTIANKQKAIKMDFKWRQQTRDGEPWNPATTVSESGGSAIERDYLNRDEREAIREAALEYDSIPGYSTVTPTERDEWNAYLATKFQMPKTEVGPEEWQRAKSWKIPSLVWAALDGGLRPIEIKRAKTGWLDLKNGVLRIPPEEAAKHTGSRAEPWSVALRERTVRALNKWTEQRDLYEQYDDTDALWLTLRGNPYQSRTLSRLLKKLCDVAGIDYDNRKMGWYAIRRSTGSYLVAEGDLSSAKCSCGIKIRKPRCAMIRVHPKNAKNS